MDKVKKARLLEIRKKKNESDKQLESKKHTELIEAIFSLHSIFNDSQKSHSETTGQLLNKLEDIGSLREEVFRVKQAIENIPKISSITVSNLSDIPKDERDIDLTEVTNAITKLVDLVKSKTIESVAINNKKASEYIPTRRVREVNGQYIFDDSPLQVSVVGGSNISTSYINEAGKNVNVELIDGRVPVNTNLLPTETDNPSLMLGYTDGKLTTITKIIDTVSYQKTLSYTVDDLTGVSAWVEI